MKVKTSEASGPVLDWMVAKAWQPVYSDGSLINALTAGYDGIGTYHEAYSPSTDWAQGGPIMQREFITIGIGEWDVDATPQVISWAARSMVDEMEDNDRWFTGPTPLVAAMRCFVASRLGEEVEVPEELI